MSPIAQIRRNLPLLETPNGRKSLTLLAHTSSTSAETIFKIFVFTTILVLQPIFKHKNNNSCLQ